MSHSQFHSIKCLYLDMHGLIFETSIWLLAGSTRFLSLPADAHLRGYQPIEKRWGLLETRPFMRFYSANTMVLVYFSMCIAIPHSRPLSLRFHEFMEASGARKGQSLALLLPALPKLTLFLYSTSLSFPHAKQPERRSIRLLSTAIGGSLEFLPFDLHLTNRPSHSPK